jgi:hypothetical protein
VGSVTRRSLRVPRELTALASEFVGFSELAGTACILCSSRHFLQVLTGG